MNTSSISLANDNFTFWRRLPLLTPAVKEDSCEVDHELLSSRINAVGIAAIGAMVASMILVTAFPTAIFATHLSCLLVLGISLPLDMWLAERAADIKAVNEYLNMSYPSKSATFRIQCNFKAAQLLVSKNGDVNKVNQEGNGLLAFCPNLRVFKLLINYGANIKSLDKHGIPYFQRAVEDENPVYLEYILKSKKVKPDDFDPTQQVDFWTNLGSIQAGSLLKNYGFNVNVRDKKEYTPLLKIVKEASIMLYMRKLGISAHISTLLNCGADRSMTIDDNGIQKNALQINTNPAIRNILEQPNS
jgi:hypothetical protein